MNIKSVTRANPCPICGKPDWCGVMRSDSGNNLFVCQRNIDALKPYKDGIYGMDGKFYLCVGISKRGQNNIFADAGELKEKEHPVPYGKCVSPKTLIPKDILSPLPDSDLHEIYLTMLNSLILEPHHREYLLKEGWTDELIEAHHIKSFPEEDYIRFQKKSIGDTSQNLWRKRLIEIMLDRFHTLEGVPGAYVNQKGNWAFAPQSGMLFPLYNQKSEIYRLRIRLENGCLGGKYRNFSSFKADSNAEKQGFLKNLYEKGCQAGNQLGYYFHYSRDDMHIAYLTEGEKKGIIGNTLLKAPVVSIPGVNSYFKLIEGLKPNRPIDFLRSIGVRILIIAFDADKMINAKVMACQERVIHILRNEGFIVGLAEWDICQGKGLDDLLVRGYKPTYVLAK